MSARLRAAVVAAATGMLALATALVAAPAYAATTNGAPVETQTQFCSPSLSARTDVAAITTGLQAQVDQDFHLVVTVAGLNQCLPSQSASVNLQLPAGVAVSSSGQSACVTFASTNPAGTTQTVPCVRSDGGSGFLRVDPQGGNSWTLTAVAATSSRCSSRCGRPQPASAPRSRGCATAGQQWSASAHPSRTPCRAWPSRSPRAPAPPASITADRLKIRKVGTVCSGGGSCPDLAVTSTSLKVQAYLIGERPAGVWRISAAARERRRSRRSRRRRSQRVGSRASRTTASGLSPFDASLPGMLQPTGGVQVCGSEITLTTASARSPETVTRAGRPPRSGS